MKFSIIIPAYNLENYITRCLDSILNQDISLNEYEVLVINDGSTDKTVTKVVPYTTSYTNVTLLTKKNGGVSSARNLGIDTATGEYILFIDGDDYLEKNVLNAIYQSLKTNNLEIARFGYNCICTVSNITETIALDSSNKIIRGIDFLIESKTSSFYPWLYPIATQFIKTNNLKFNTSLSFCEDKEFLIRALLKTDKFKNFDLVFYNYILGRNDAASTAFSNKHIADLTNANFIIYNFSNSLENKNHKDFIQNMIINSIENSYYILTLDSFYTKYALWKNIIISNNKFKKDISEKSKKLNLLYNNSVLFYIQYYFPRAIFHTVNNIFKRT